MSAMQAAFDHAGIQSVEDRLKAAIQRIVAMSEAEAANDVDGWQPDAEVDRLHRRLMQVATEALKSAPRNWDGAKDALLKSVRKDAELMWALFAPFRNQAVQLVLTEAATKMRDEERAQRAAVVRPVEMHARAGGGKGHVPIDDRPGRARPTATRSAEAAAAVGAVARLSLLDTFKVNGRAIGDLTAEEANAWAGSRERDARFVRMLTANIPNDRPIRDFRTGDDAQELYQRSVMSGE